MAPVSTWKKQKVHKDNMLENRQKKSQFRYFMECFWEFVTGRTFGVFLDQENGHLQWSCLDKICFKLYHLMTQPLKMVVKTPMSSKDPVGEQEDRCRRMVTYNEVVSTKVASNHHWVVQILKLTKLLQLDLWRTWDSWQPFWVVVSSSGIICSNFC